MDDAVSLFVEYLGARVIPDDSDIPDDDGWFVAQRFPGTFDSYGVLDRHYLRDQWVSDFRLRGPGHKGPWKGTKDNAINLAKRLNHGTKPRNFTEQSVTQAAHFATYKREEEKARKRVSASVSAFKRCKCGAMYKGESHCVG